MSWDQYSQTPASNDLSGYFQTGMAPSKVKNAGWDIMADLSQFMSLPTSAGTANAQTITNIRQFGALFAGMRVSFIPGNTNTGAVTLAVDGLTAKNIYANGVAATAGMLQTSVPAHCQYDGTQFNLLNPQRSTGSFTITLTGMTATTTGTINYAIEPDGKTAWIWAISNILGTSNTTAMTGTGIPAALSANSGAFAGIWIAGEDNSASILTWVQGLNGTTWTFLKGASQTTWTSSASKGLTPFKASYNLD